MWTPVAGTGQLAQPVNLSEAPSSIPRPVAWLLLAPAGVLLLVSYVWPTVDLLLTSLTADDGIATNLWQRATYPSYRGQFGHALSFALVPILVLATVAPLFAWLASRAGLAARWVVRVALVLPLAVYAPTGLAMLWLSRQRSGLRALTEPRPETWDGRVVIAATLGAFLVAVAATCYLAALRRRDAGRPAWPAVLVVGVFLALVTVGLALAQYTYASLIDQAPGVGQAGTPMTLAETVHIDLALGRVVPVTVLPLLAVLGVAATALAIGSRLRLEYDPARRSADDRAGPARTLAVAGTALGVVGLLVVAWLQLGPWLSELVTGGADPVRWLTGVTSDAERLPAGATPWSVLANTWLIPLGNALVQVTVAIAAAFGIAVVRPLGRHSEWLLLLFAPWLLFGDGLLQLARVEPAAEPVPTVIAFATPSWVSIPALLVFTFLFRGLAARWQELRAAGQPPGFLQAMWPALPMALVVTGVLWLARAQALLAPTLTPPRGQLPHGQLLLARDQYAVFLPGEYTPDPAVGYPLVMLALLVLAGLILQLSYLDRVAIRVGPASPGRRDSAGGR